MAITSANQLELLQTAEAVAREKMIEPELVIQAMEDSLARAAKSRYGADMDIRVKIDRKTQERLYTDLTQLNFQLADGRRTNKLGHLMEKAQSGETPDYGLIAQVVMLLEDPPAYHEKFAAVAVSEQVIATARKLKTEAANKVASSGAGDEPDAPIQRKKLARPVSIFTGK